MVPTPLLVLEPVTDTMYAEYEIDGMVPEKFEELA
jgi:hypothetical protein